MRQSPSSSLLSAFRAQAPRRTRRTRQAALHAQWRPASGALLVGTFAAALSFLAPSAQAERADRNKEMAISTSGTIPNVVDLNKHSALFAGNVIITQGTLVIHADRVEVSEDPDGQRLGYAFGSADHPATFRQKRDGEDEYSEGEAQKIEYDSAANRVRFVGAAHLRMLRGTVVTDQASAPLITYDTAAETIALNGAGASSSNANSTTSTINGRPTVVFTPKAPSSAPPPPPLTLPTPAAAAASGAAR
jgi:lipopolysaccharide export system protein LptA